MRKIGAQSWKINLRTLKITILLSDYFCLLLTPRHVCLTCFVSPPPTITIKKNHPLWSILYKFYSQINSYRGCFLVSLERDSQSHTVDHLYCPRVLQPSKFIQRLLSCLNRKELPVPYSWSSPLTLIGLYKFILTMKKSHKLKIMHSNLLSSIKIINRNHFMHQITWKSIKMTTITYLNNIIIKLIFQ